MIGALAVHARVVPRHQARARPAYIPSRTAYITHVTHIAHAAAARATAAMATAAAGATSAASRPAGRQGLAAAEDCRACKCGKNQLTVHR